MLARPTRCSAVPVPSAFWMKRLEMLVVRALRSEDDPMAVRRPLRVGIDARIERQPSKAALDEIQEMNVVAPDREWPLRHCGVRRQSRLVVRSLWQLRLAFPCRCGRPIPASGVSARPVGRRRVCRRAKRHSWRRRRRRSRRCRRPAPDRLAVPDSPDRIARRAACRLPRTRDARCREVFGLAAARQHLVLPGLQIEDSHPRRCGGISRSQREQHTPTARQHRGVPMVRFALCRFGRGQHDWLAAAGRHLPQTGGGVGGREHDAVVIAPTRSARRIRGSRKS